MKKRRIAASGKRKTVYPFAQYAPEDFFWNNHEGQIGDKHRGEQQGRKMSQHRQGKRQERQQQRVILSL